MPLRAGDAAGFFTDVTIANAMNYACAEGADVVNGSFGGEGYSPVIASAISSCPGTLFVFAAGNGGIDQVGDNIDASPPMLSVCLHARERRLCRGEHRGRRHRELLELRPGVGRRRRTRDRDPEHDQHRVATPQSAARRWLPRTSRASPRCSSPAIRLRRRPRSSTPSCGRSIRSRRSSARSRPRAVSTRTAC